MLESLLHLDTALFVFINQTGSNALLDLILPLVRNKYLWTPFYAFLFFFLIFNFKWKGLIYTLFVLLCFGVADTLSSKIIKPAVARYRPCDPRSEIENVNLLLRCRRGYSFTSSHATNHFALAWFLFLTLGKRFRWLRAPVLIWACLVSYAQIYVGLHYPGDILGGFLVGTTVAFFIDLLFRFSKFHFEF